MHHPMPSNGAQPPHICAGTKLVAKTNAISMDWLRECFSLDEETGDLYWRHRPASHFSTDANMLGFNRRFAGRRADEGMYPTVGYRRVRVSFNGRKIAISAHRIVYALAYGRWPSQVVDHIDRCRSNNRPDNLRDVDQSVNTRNTAWHAERSMAA
jgi:hypothetical protein